MPLIPLAQALDPSVCGAKAVNLARLAGLGHRVPVGFVITDYCYREHLARAGMTQACGDLQEELPELDAAAIQRRAQVIRDALAGTPIAPALIRMLIAQIEAQDLNWPLIVRSSAAAEDTQNASFAGLLDSVPDVASAVTLRQALLKVWLSPWSQRYLTYAKTMGGAGGGLGVIVQRQVDASFSGVLFTHDPRGGATANDALVEYVSGMGDRLASGELTPARLNVARHSLAVHRETFEDNASAARPSETVIEELARISFGLEENLGYGLDIEWCLDQQGSLTLLQARPITVGRTTVLETWTNANIAENFPDPVTPLTFSIVSRGYTAYFRNLGLGYGLSRQRVDAMMPRLSRIVGLHGARLYYNLSNIHAVLHMVPRGEKLAAWFNQFTGAREFPRADVPAMAWPERLAEALRVAVCVAGQYLRVRSRVAAFEQCVDSYASQTRTVLLHGQAPEQLAAHLKTFLDIRVNRWNNAALADAAAMVCYGLLRHVLNGVRDSEGRPAQPNDLLKGLPGLVSTRPVAELWRLSRFVRADVKLRERFLNANPEELARVINEPPYVGIRAQFDTYLDEWGFRYSGELTLVAPTPQEDPLPLLRILRGYVAEEGGGPEEISAEQMVARLAATGSVEERLTPQPWLRASPLSRAGRFRIVLKSAQGAIRLRERARMKQALLYTRLRHVLLRMGEAFVASKWLARREDIFFLLPEEILDIARKGRFPALLANELAGRMREFETHSRAQPPDSFVLPAGQAWQGDSTRGREHDSEATDDVLRGDSACGGCAEGEAAVVLNVANADEVRSGQILVTRQTDPGWAAVFFLVKGIIIERGGMLSHGAIIAREYGIPAVIGVADATKRIANGQHILVDGDSGVVKRLSL